MKKYTLYLSIFLLVITISLFHMGYNNRSIGVEYLEYFLYLGPAIFILITYFNYRIEVNGDYIIYTNLFRKSRLMRFSDFTGYKCNSYYSKYGKNRFFIQLYNGEKRMLKVSGSLDNAEYLLADIKKHNIPEI